jgi:succinoglycan biosynthesis protein ExoL
MTMAQLRSRDVDTGRDAGVPRMVYIVYNLNDHAVRRRIRMLRRGGVEQLVVVGYRRQSTPIADIDGTPVVDLGRNADGQLVRRAGALALTRLRRSRWGGQCGVATVVMARNLEALVLAASYRDRFAPAARLVYESLDVHNALLGGGVASRTLRAVEARALRGCQLLLTSSPAYVREYYAHLTPHLPPVAVQENKVLADELDPAVLARLRADRHALDPAPGPPWRIGWFSQMRCARSLELLAGLCREFPGHVEVVMRGQPSGEIAARLVATAEATPGMSFLGSYDRSTELAAIHADVHYCWGLDLYNAGGNSDWALATRLYESGVFGCVPLGQAGVATGDWLAARGVGVLLDTPYGAALRAWARGLTPALYAADRTAMAGVPLGDFVDTDDDAAAFVALLAGHDTRVGLT